MAIYLAIMSRLLSPKTSFIPGQKTARIKQVTKPRFCKFSLYIYVYHNVIKQSETPVFVYF